MLLCVGGWAVAGSDASYPEPDSVVADTIDLTSKLVNPNFNGGSAAPGWTVNTGKIEVKAASTGNPVVTAYGYQVDICQTVEGLEPGKYLVKVQACSRSKDRAAGIADYEAKKAAGEEMPNEAYLYANGEQKKLVNIWDETSDYDFFTEYGKTDIEKSDITMSDKTQIPYNSTNFATAFTKGMYWNELTCTVGADGTLTLGIKNELQGGDGITPYVGYDNFQLYKINEIEEYTSQIVNPGFTDDNSTAQSGWTLVSGSAKGKWSKGTENRGFSCNNIKCELTQTVEGLKPGKYMLKYQAFGRMKANDASWASYLAGEDLGSTNVYMIANATKKEVMNVVYGATPNKGAGDWTTVQAADGSELYLLNNSGAVADAFAQGYYQDSLETVVGEDGKLTITFLKESVEDNSGDYSKYAGCDNFRLYRTGDAEEEEPGDELTEVRDRIAIPAGSANGDELTVEVLEKDEAGNTLSAKYTVTNGTWGNNASHLSFFKFAPLSAATIEGYEKIVVEFAETVPTATGDATYGFIPVGLVSPVNWTSMNGLDKWEYTFTEDDKAKGIEDFSLFYNASGDLKDIEVTITGIYLVKAAGSDEPGDEPGDEPSDEPAEEALDMRTLIDMTDLLVNPGFTDEADKAQTGWTLVTGTEKGKWSKGTANRGFSCNNIKCELTQTVEGLEPGQYVLMYQAFGRMKANDASWASYLAGEDLGSTNVYMIANDTKKEVMNVVYGATPDKGAGDWTTVKGADGSDLYLLNNSGAVADAFAQGYYEDYLRTEVGEDGKLTITFLKESVQDDGNDYSKYAGCDNFRLYKVFEPIDMTNKIVNPNFTDGTSTGWTSNNGEKIEVKQPSSNNPVISAYNYQVNVSQTIEGLEPGLYLVKVQACSRHMDGQKGIQDYESKKAAGQEIVNEAYLYANNEQVKVKNIFDETRNFDFAGESGQNIEVTRMSNGEQIPYNTKNFSRAFGEFGMYENELKVVVGQNGVLTIGIKNELPKNGDIVPYLAYDNFRLYRIGNADEEDGPAFDLYDLKAEAGQYVAISMPYAVKSEYFGQVYKIAEIQNGQAVLVAVDGVASGEPCVVKASGESNIKEGDVKLSYTTPKPALSMWDNTMMQADLTKLTWTATAIDGSDIDVANLTYTEADLANMDFTCTIENNAAARFWAQNPDYAAETPTAIGKYIGLPAYNRTDQPNPITIPVVAAEKEQNLTYCLSEDMMGAETITIPAGKTVAEIYNLMPGLTYYYKTADGKSAGKFTVGGTLRMMMIGKNVVNMRDLGGKKTVDGRYVKYGKIFRNAEFKGGTFNIDATELQMLLDLNIGAELDLRNEDGNKPWLPNAKRGDNFYWAEGKNYIANGPGKMYDAVAKPHLKAEFETVVNNLRNGVAVDFHCRIGADRTGFLAFLLEGLLGVSETDLLLDYETTSFSEAGLRTKADGDGDAAASSYEKVIPAEFRSKIPEGGTLRDVFEAYFINTLGVDSMLIKEYRNIMLAESPIADVQDEQTHKFIDILKTEIEKSKLYEFGEEYGQFTSDDQSAVDDYMKAVAHAELFLNESEGLTLEGVKNELKSLSAANETMMAAISLNTPKAGDQFFMQSKSYGRYIRNYSKTNWTMYASANTNYCIFTFDGRNITSNATGLTFGYDAKNGVASAIAVDAAETPAVLVPSELTPGCYNIQIGDYLLKTTNSSSKLEAVNKPQADCDIILVKYVDPEEDAIRDIEMAGESTNAYNLVGQKVNGSYKGVVIRNGKKTVVK